jgi:ketosteroid isomerase-like protein
MSEENAQIVRDAYDLWNRGDLDSFMGLIDEEVVIRAAEGWPEPVFYGKDSARSFFEGLVESIGHDSVIEELTGSGSTVVIRVRTGVTGGQSGIETEIRSSQVITLRKGKAVLLEYFWDHQDALDAAGLKGAP